MKPFAFLCCFLFLSCYSQAQLHLFKSKKQDSTSLRQDSTGFGVVKPVHKKKRHEVLPLRPFYVLTGKFRDNQVFLWIAIRDSVLRGAIRYGKSWDTAHKVDSFPVYGTVERDGRLLFCTFTP